MAKTAKVRDYSNVNAQTGLGTLSVNVGTLEAPQYTKVSDVATNFAALQKLVASASGETGNNLFSIYTRGIESATRVSYKSKHNTTVSLGGKRKVDLMDIAASTNPKFGLKTAVAMINGRFDTLDILSIRGEDDKTSPADIAKEIAAMRKRESGWYNTADALVAQGKVTLQDGRLRVI